MSVLAKVFQESIILVVQELRANILRSLLSLLGVTIGIFCIIAVLSAVDSLKRNLESGLGKLGTNVLYVQKWAWGPPEEGQEYPWWEYMKRPSPTHREYRMLSQRLQGAEAVAIQTFRNSRQVKYGRQVVRNVDVTAVTNEYDRIYSLVFAQGRWFSAGESQGGHPVVVLGATVAEELFPGRTHPIGKEVWVLGQKVRVVGVLEKEGESLIDFSNDELVLLPYEYLRRFSDTEGPFSDNMILIEAREGVSNAALTGEIIPRLRAYRHLKPMENNDFSINEVTIATKALKQSFTVLNVIGFIIGGFALLVGGFGIANIMFVSVRERTPMIGIKKSLGARNRFILLEFLLEAVLLCLIGCGLGLLMVWGLLGILEKAVNFPFVLSGTNILIGTLVSTVLGLVFGMVPAWMASRMDPVEAIRQ
jgi:putative ABC transport system permease protein